MLGRNGSAGLSLTVDGGVNRSIEVARPGVSEKRAIKDELYSHLARSPSPKPPKGGERRGGRGLGDVATSRVGIREISGD